MASFRKSWNYLPQHFPRKPFSLAETKSVLPEREKGSCEGLKRLPCKHQSIHCHVLYEVLLCKTHRALRWFLLSLIPAEPRSPAILWDAHKAFPSERVWMSGSCTVISTGKITSAYRRIPEISVRFSTEPRPIFLLAWQAGCRPKPCKHVLTTTSLHQWKLHWRTHLALIQTHY